MGIINFAGAVVVAAATGQHLSLSLDDAIKAALANNLTYRQSRADERIAMARVTQAGAGRIPTLGTGYSYVHNQYAAGFNVVTPTPSGLKSEFVPISAKDINNVNATLQYALYTGGAVQAAIGQAAAGLAAAESQSAAARANVIRDTVEAYFRLVAARRNADIAHHAVTVAEENLRTAEELFGAGTAARADVLRQQVTLADAKTKAIRADNEAALANAGLANLLNIDLGSDITSTEPLEQRVGAPSANLDFYLSSAKEKRPELAAAQDAVLIADRAVQAARAPALPTVAVQVEEASSKPNFLGVPQPQLVEMLSATWKLFDGGLTRGKVAEAHEQVDKAKLALQQLQNSVDLEVRQAYLNLLAVTAQLDVARTAQTSADENLRVSRIRYKAGVGTALELSEALLQDEQAQQQLVSALADLRIAMANLARASGRL